MTSPAGITVLHAPIFTDAPLPRALKCALLDHLWPLPASHASPQDTDYFGAYFAHFQRECAPALLNQHAIQTYADFVDILDAVRDNAAATLAAIRLLIANLNPALCSDQTRLSASIELVVNLWLLVSVTDTSSRSAFRGPRI